MATLLALQVLALEDTSAKEGDGGSLAKLDPGPELRQSDSYEGTCK